MSVIRCEQFLYCVKAAGFAAGGETFSGHAASGRSRLRLANKNDAASHRVRLITGLDKRPPLNQSSEQLQLLPPTRSLSIHLSSHHVKGASRHSVMASVHP